MLHHIRRETPVRFLGCDMDAALTLPAISEIKGRRLITQPTAGRHSAGNGGRWQFTAADFP
jgi:hypothetical protein